jgi:2-polyprenyl-3-methyl-5-hydroxy-6-metoxy-1,4-benzoquinol methylase
MAVEKKEIKSIRKHAFSKKFDCDTELVNTLNDNMAFLFLKNPVVQNIYKYQIYYLCSLSKKWFNNKTVNILDWGCGWGQVSYWLKKMDKNVVSCDVDNTGATSALKMDITKLEHNYILPFADSSFEVVLSFGVLEHVPNELESLKEISRILKPNGLFFCFYLPYKLSYTQHIAHLRNNWYHSRLYWKKTVKELLGRTNLEILDMWHRALFPKRAFVPPFYHTLEKIDNWLCNYSLLKYFATNIEFVAKKLV